MARHPLPAAPWKRRKSRRSTATNIFGAALLGCCLVIALGGLATAVYFQHVQGPAPATAAVRSPEPMLGHPVIVALAPAEHGAPPAPARASANPAPVAGSSTPPHPVNAPAIGNNPAPPRAPPQVAALPSPAPATPTHAAEPIAPLPLPPPAKPLPPPSAAAAAPAKALAFVPPPAATMPRAKEPAMIRLPAGSFMMGSDDDPSEKPVHPVTVRAFAIGKYPVTVGEWRQCVAAHACADVETATLGNDDVPIGNVSWSDAEQYVAWLAKETHKHYRLPTEAEWEYAARGGTQTVYWWGNEPLKGMADCKGCTEPYDPHHPAKVGAFKPNPYGLHDMTGTVDEWVADCWHRDYEGAPEDQAVWGGGDCTAHVLRGGSWQNDITYARASSRDHYDTGVRYLTHGFRLALTE